MSRAQCAMKSGTSSITEPAQGPDDLGSSGTGQRCGQKPPLKGLISTHDFHEAAIASFPAKTLAFVDSAATDLHTYRRNSAVYAAITLRPRALCDVRNVSIRTSMLGHALRTPIFVAPTSLVRKEQRGASLRQEQGRTVHPEGERELARACARMGTAQVISTCASFTVDEIAAAFRSCVTDDGGALFFQLYVDKDRARSEHLLRECVFRRRLVSAVFVTVDAAVAGKREADERVPASPDVAVAMTGIRATNDERGGALGRVIGSFVDAGLTWADLDWVRACVGPDVPMVLKGIQTAADALRAMRAGVQGIVVSNHGGRNLDTSPATLLVLLELQRCCPEVFDRLEVFIDGGIMRGSDVFKCMALGARAVGIGRGALYGLNYGEEGLRRYIEILNDELETTMRLCGVTSLDQVHPGMLNTRAVDHLIPETAAEEHPYAKWRPGRGKL